MQGIDQNKLVLPPGMSLEQFEDLMAQCSLSLKKHCLLFHGSELGEWPEKRFNRAFSYNHDQFFEVWDDPSIRKIKIVAHRGWGKTSLIEMGAPSQSIIFKKYPFIVNVSATLEAGAMVQTENLKRELMIDPSIKSVIGDIETSRFSKEMWETSNGCMIFPRGRGQQVRGLLYGNYRVNLITCSDIEDRESVASKEAVDKTVEYIYADLLRCVDPGRNDWRFVMIGTYLAHDNALLRLEDDKEFVVLDFPLTRDEKTFVSLWPERFTDEQVRKLYDEAVAIGRPDIFAREFLNKPVMQEDIVFKPAYFKYFSTEKGAVDQFGRSCYHLDLADDRIETFVLVDPAKTSNMRSDYTAIVGVSILFTSKGNFIFVRDVVKEKFFPDQIYEAMFGMAKRLGTRIIGVEFNSLNEFIRQPIMDYMRKSGQIYEIVELKPRQATGEYVTKYKGKEGRVAAIAPYYRTGVIYHNVNGSSDPLEHQLIMFPSTNEWDVMDAFAYFPQMLEYGGRGFADETLPDTVEEQGMEDEDPAMEREFAKLEKMLALEDEEDMSGVTYSRG